ncbi:hypothetical protein SXIM_13930 [Streptomyces xiamenensis]|uniref:Uncharacterized protein n=1 Tax=Streptomyces xiamenensis TaxID=408015 RepID=A0A0F7FRD9_9ACTN|nr:hypothetical protein SXIM_13930 [Streptomyces xiamenensis]
MNAHARQRGSFGAHECVAPSTAAVSEPRIVVRNAKKSLERSHCKDIFAVLGWCS